MGTIASQIISLTIVFSTVYWDTDQRKHQSSASLVFVRGIHRGPVNSRHKWPVARKMFPFADVIMVVLASISQIWAHNWNLVKSQFVFKYTTMIRSGRKFAHVTTAKLFWHVQNCDLISYHYSCEIKINFYNIWVRSSTLCETGTWYAWERFGFWI